MDPKVSIIIATYNSGKTLRRALDSVLNQTFQDWECIVVDGASKDETVSIVEEFELKDARFRHISEKDHGIYDAFNKGWRMAKGEWIHYLGSDDKLTKESFLKLLELPVGSTCAVVSGSTYIEKLDGKIIVLPSIGWDGCHQAKLTKRVVIDEIGGFDESYPIKADKELYYRIRKKYGVMNSDSIVAYFSMAGASQNIVNSWKRCKEDIRIYKSHNIVHPHIKAYKIFLRGVISHLFRKLRGEIIH